MIAISHEDPRRRAREERYALRRILIRKLQQTTRGVTRRTRYTRQHQFAEEWRQFTASGRIVLVQRALAVGPAVAAEAGSEWRSSLLLSLAAEAQGERCVHWEERRPTAPANRFREPEPNQVELFGAQLVSQPV